MKEMERSFRRLGSSNVYIFTLEYMAKGREHLYMETDRFPGEASAYLTFLRRAKNLGIDIQIESKYKSIAA